MVLDFSSNLDYVWALLPEIILCVWGMVVLLAGVWHGASSEESSHAEDLGWLALVGVALAAVANGWLHGVREVGTDGMIAVDGFRLFSNWIFLTAALMGMLVSFAYVYRQRLQAGEYYALMLFSVAGMMFMAGARNLIVVFLGLEVMSIAVYTLSAFNRRDRRSAEAGLKYFLLGAFSTGFFLYGIALVYGATGSTHLPTIALAVSGGAARGALLLFGVALIGVGFAFKVSAVPFHMWTPDVYEGAPSPVTAFMSAGVKAAAFAAFFRVFLVSFQGIYESWYGVMWWLSAITMVGANLIALVQTNVKRMLAYSSVAHGGYLLVAITAANQASAGAAFVLSPGVHGDEHRRVRGRDRGVEPGRGAAGAGGLRRPGADAAWSGPPPHPFPAVSRGISGHRRIYGQVPAAAGRRGCSALDLGRHPGAEHGRVLRLLPAPRLVRVDARTSGRELATSRVRPDRDAVGAGDGCRGGDLARTLSGFGAGLRTRARSGSRGRRRDGGARALARGGIRASQG